MPRNLDRRVELLVPVDDPACRDRLIRILQVFFRDTAKARRLQPDGSHVRVKPDKGAAPLRCQEEFYQLAREAARAAQKQKTVVFEPQRPANTA